MSPERTSRRSGLTLPGNPAAWRRAALALVALGLLAIVILFSSCGGDDGGTAINAATAGQYHGALITPTVKKPDVVLTDSDGKPFDLRKQTDGTLTLLYVGYTHCPDICPTHMANIATALGKLPAEMRAKTKVVFITSDPERDTPQLLGEWVKAFDPSFVGLTGDAASLGKVYAAIGMDPPQKSDLGNGGYAVSHAAYVLAYTSDNMAHIAYPGGIEIADWLHDLPLLATGWKAS